VVPPAARVVSAGPDQQELAEQGGSLMRRPVTIALRFVLIVATVTALAVVLAPAPTSKSPYLSALSDVGLGTAALAKPCANTACTTTLPPRCVAGTNTHCVYKGTRCVRTTSC